MFKIVEGSFLCISKKALLPFFLNKYSVEFLLIFFRNFLGKHQGILFQIEMPAGIHIATLSFVRVIFCQGS